jgi:hypothetical protein
MPRAALVLALLLAALPAAAQQRTNKDQSRYTELRDGGYPIRRNPLIVPAAEAKVGDAELVIGVEIAGVARAYPVNLMWGPESETLNDAIGGVAVATTWCPVAHSAAVYERTVGGRTLDLGTLGLELGVFKLYDRQTGSKWSQVSGAAESGPMSRRTLKKRESMLTTWGQWRRLHPETSVFFDPALPNHHPFDADTIARITLAGEGPLRNEDLVAGVEAASGSRAWLLRALAGPRVLDDAAAGEPVVVVLAADDVTVRVLSRRVGGRVLSFSRATPDRPGDRLRDAETGSDWAALTGLAVAGPLAGRRLEPRVVTTALWYAWRSQHPGTTLWGADLPADSKR